MSDIIPVEVDDQTIYLEVDQRFGSEETSAIGKTIDVAQDAFEHARTTIITVAKSMVGAVRQLDQSMAPDEFELEFAIKFNAEGQAILAKATAEASLKIVMTYKHKEDV